MYQKLQHRSFNGDGRSDRASLQKSYLFVRGVTALRVDFVTCPVGTHDLCVRCRTARPYPVGTHTEGPRRGPTNHSRGSKGQSPERPTDARRLLIYRPLEGRTRRVYSSSPTSRPGEVACFVWLPSPPVVRSFAPPTGGYDSSDRKRSATLLALQHVTLHLGLVGTLGPTCNPP